MKICFDTKKSPTWTSGDLEFDDYNQSQPSGLEMPLLIAIPALWLGIMDIIAVPAIVINKNTIFHTISFQNEKSNAWHIARKKV